jgi:hypothetical protein
VRKMHRDATEFASRPALCVVFIVGNLRVRAGVAVQRLTSVSAGL